MLENLFEIIKVIFNLYVYLEIFLRKGGFERFVDL